MKQVPELKTMGETLSYWNALNSELIYSSWKGSADSFPWELMEACNGGGDSVCVWGNWGHTHMMFTATAQPEVINMVSPLIS